MSDLEKSASELLSIINRDVAEWRKQNAGLTLKETSEIILNQMLLRDVHEYLKTLDKKAHERGWREENEACAKIAEDGLFCTCDENTMRRSPCNACHRKMEARGIAHEIRARMEKK